MVFSRSFATLDRIGYSLLGLTTPAERLPRTHVVAWGFGLDSVESRLARAVVADPGSFMRCRTKVGQDIEIERI